MTSAEPIGPRRDGAGADRWRLGLRVEPLVGEPFAAVVEAYLPEGEPAVGGRVEVLHDPPRRGWLDRASRGVPIGTLLLGTPPLRGRDEPPEDGSGDDHAGPSAAEVARALLEGVRDGSLAGGAPIVVTAADCPGPPAPPADGPLGGLSLDELAARVGDDAPGAVDEVARRLRAGEATPAQMLRAASAAGLPPARIAAVAAAVAAGPAG